MTTNDTIGYNCIAYWVHGYMKHIGEIPTKEEFLEYNDVGDAVESYLGIKGEHLEKILSDTLYQELDYTEIFQCTSASSFEFATPQGIFIASNYLLTHPTIQFINQDSCLLVVDSTVYEHDGSIAKMSLSMPEVMIKDSAYYYKGVKLSSIKEYDNKAFFEIDAPNRPILIDYNSPVELIDTLCTYFFGIYKVRTKPIGRGDKYICLYHSAPHVREADSVSNLPVYVLTDSLKQIIGYIDEYELDEEPPFDMQPTSPFEQNDEVMKQVDDEALLKKFVYDVQRAQSVIYRSNDTIYLNGKPVNDSCSVNEKSILIDLTHDNTYRDVCEIARFLIKKTSSKDFKRSRYYFKSDDKIYKYLINKHPEWKVKVTSDD
ncbi:MAG: hypothetical protein IK017_03665 [Paludibacteraceae bacterium]|nr:hypothetical protein [Paludibacteraceae bacterium]